MQKRTSFDMLEVKKTKDKNKFFPITVSTLVQFNTAKNTKYKSVIIDQKHEQSWENWILRIARLVRFPDWKGLSHLFIY